MLIFAIRTGQLLSAFAGASVVIYAGIDNGWIVGGGAMFGGWLFTEVLQSLVELHSRFWPGERGSDGDGAPDVLPDSLGPDRIHDGSVRKLPGPDSR